jgi:RNA polymerase-binding transcription factor DksA
MADIIDIAAEREEEVRRIAIENAKRPRNSGRTGNTGLCLNCGDTIGEERLAATPLTILCIDCATEAEVF